jgi:acetyl-CoA carboxylase biotin carboxylase subunit
MWRGHALECRIYAEDPDNGFFPSPGKILQLERPAGPGIRLDSGVYQGWTVPLEYDPLLAKLAVWGETREVAIERMLRAIAEYYIAGITTNLSFFRQILQDKEFRAGHLHTGFLGEFFERSRGRTQSHDGRELVAALVAALHSTRKPETVPPPSRWRGGGRERFLQ